LNDQAVGGFSGYGHPPRIIGTGLGSRLIGSSTSPSDSSVRAPANVASPGSPNMTSAPPAFSLYLKSATPLRRLIQLPFVRLNSSVAIGRILKRRNTAAGNTE
jgi:hypothetical protein